MVGWSWPAAAVAVERITPIKASDNSVQAEADLILFLILRLLILKRCQADNSVQRIFGNGDRVPWKMTNEAHALALTGEALWMRKLQPAVIFAFVNVFRRTTATFISRDVHRRRFALRHDEGVVNDDVFRCVEVLRAMHTAIHLFESLARDERLFSAASVFHS